MPDTLKVPGRWVPPTEERVPLKVHPEVRDALRQLLIDDPDLHGVGYSEFIMGAILAHQSTPVRVEPHDA